MQLGPEAAALVQSAMAAGGPPLHQLSPDQARQVIDALMVHSGHPPKMAAVKDHRISTEGADILVRVLTPTPAPKAVIVFLHGGGWVAGTAAGHETVGRQIAAATGCIVAIPDYRRAPDVRFPVPLDDCFAAVVWAATAFDLPLIVMGDSAGGNMAAAITQMAKAAGGPTIAAQVLIYPVTDCGMDTASYRDPANALLLTPDAMAWFWDHYLPDKTQRSDPRAAPLRGTDLSGLPPAIVVLASHDILRDEGQAYADRLIEAGVPCRVETAVGEIHGFFVLGGLMPAAGIALKFVARGLADILG